MNNPTGIPTEFEGKPIKVTQNSLATFYDVPEVYSILRSWLRSDQPFCHTRWNDGEGNCMFALLPEHYTTSGEHQYQRDLGQEMRKTFTEQLTSSNPNLLLGASWFDVGGGNHVLPASKAIHEWLLRWPWELPKGNCPYGTRWVAGDIWYRTEQERDGKPDTTLIDFLKEIRDTVDDRPIILVGNPTILPAYKCLNATFVQIPRKDAWTKYREVLETCEVLSATGPNAVFVWCAGFPGKLWMWELFKKFPETSHIDAGHLFDAACGVFNRMWLRREGGPHWEWYKANVIPFVKSS